MLLVVSARAQGTAFTYQGRLTDGTNAANGNYDLTFSLFSVPSGAGQIGSTLTNVAIAVNSGLFTVTLDFGANFPGADRWLEIAGRTNGSGVFGTLTPRQQITSTPYAIMANTASNLLGALPAGQLSGTLASALLNGTYSSAVTLNNAANSFTGNGTGLANVNAATLGGLNSSNFWRTGGNAGTTAGTHFLGTTDNQPLEFKVNGLRALRLEDNGDSAYYSDGVPDGAPNVIGGSAVNFVAAGVVGATISGGGATNFAGDPPYTNSVLADFGVIGGGSINRIAPGSFSSIIAGGYGNDIGTNSSYSTIGGGSVNHIATNSGSSTIGGGEENNIAASSSESTIAGGILNDIGPSSGYSAIGGGFNNNVAEGSSGATIAGGSDNDIGAESDYSAIGGGSDNNIAAFSPFATIPGGQQNTAAARYAFAAGRRAKANHQGAFVWADSTDADFSTTANNQFLIRASGGVGIGTVNPATVLHVKNAGDTQISIESSDAGSRRWTLQSSAVSGSAIDAAFQIIDRTVSQSRLYILTNGNVGIGIVPTNKLHVAGGVSATVFVTTSDRNAKENFSAVDARAMLEKVAALPITQWNFKEDKGTPHIGPMAQDFYAAFKVGPGAGGIATVDADGVALAAIQGLNQKVEEKEARVTALEKELAELKQLVVKISTKGN